MNLFGKTRCVMKRLMKKAEILELYHGTSSDKLDSILATGLKIVIGGQGDGAYMTSNYEDARKYSLKRAGDRYLAGQLKDYDKYKNVYPVIVVIKIDSSEVRQTYSSNMLAENGVSPDKISNTIDLRDDIIWQNLEAYCQTHNSEDKEEKSRGQELYRTYVQETSAIV